MEKKKEQVLNAALEIIRRQGIQSLVMDDVASDCGISKKTLYKIFESKEALLKNISENYFNQIKSTFDSSWPKESSLAEVCEHIINHLFMIIETIPYGSLKFIKQYHPLAHKMFKGYLDSIGEELRIQLEGAQFHSETHGDIVPRIQVTLLMNNLRYLHLNYYILLRKGILEDFKHNIILSFMRSIKAQD